MDTPLLRLLFLIFTFSVVPQLARAAEAAFFVAPSGNDAWSGKLSEPNRGATDGPFATLVRARDAVRELIAEGLSEPVTVMVRGGKYYLPDTLLLNQKDSGTRDHPVAYKAYPGEKPVLSGGRRITGWKPYKGKILQAAVPEAKGGHWRFRQLFLDNERQIRARYPNFDPDNPLYGGWASPLPLGEGRPDAFKYKPGLFERQWAKPREAEVFLLEFFGLTDIVPLKSIDRENNIITLTERVRDHSDMPYVSYPEIAPAVLESPRDQMFHMPIGGRSHFYVANVLEELDQPGEWCLD